MKKHNKTSCNSLHKRQNKDTNKRQLLRKYVEENEYIDVTKQHEICEKFGLPYIASIFREVYRNRFYAEVFKEPSTAATVEHITGIPHKYLTECKAYYEKKGLLKVLAIGVCPTTKSRNVQFVSTNPEHWGSFEIPNDGLQLKLWEDRNG